MRDPVFSISVLESNKMRQAANSMTRIEFSFT
jgi:hypothetical protein